MTGSTHEAFQVYPSEHDLLIYFDQPQMFFYTSSKGTRHLVTCIDEDDVSDTWLIVEILEEAERRFRLNLVDMHNTFLFGKKPHTVQKFHNGELFKDSWQPDIVVNLNTVPKKDIPIPGIFLGGEGDKGFLKVSRENKGDFQVVLPWINHWCETWDEAEKFAHQHTKGLYEIWQWDSVEGAYLHIF